MDFVAGMPKYHIMLMKAMMEEERKASAFRMQGNPRDYKCGDIHITYCLKDIVSSEYMDD